MEDRLRKFATLVEMGSFTKAAIKLHLSQPALTIAINKLERELGCQLLVRGTRSFSVTPSGKLAYRSAKELAVSVNNLHTNLRAISDEVPNVTIGVIDSIAAALFDSHTREESYEDLMKLSVTVNNSQNLLKALIQLDVDVAFITEQTARISDLLVIDSVGIEPMLLACHPDQKTELETQLRHHQPIRFVSYDQPSTSFRLIQAGLAECSIAVLPIFYSSSPEVMVKLVLRGAGCSVLPYFMVRELLKAGSLALVKYPDRIVINRPISIALRRGEILPQALTHVPLKVRDLLSRQYQSASALS